MTLQLEHRPIIDDRNYRRRLFQLHPSQGNNAGAEPSAAESAKFSGRSGTLPGRHQLDVKERADRDGERDPDAESFRKAFRQRRRDDRGGRIIIEPFLRRRS
jgi:hypothetical protein